MVFDISPGRPLRHRQSRVLNGRDVEADDASLEIGALRAENAELRKIVIELSKLVIRNVLRNDHGS
jgi:hypothetical protein